MEFCPPPCNSFSCVMGHLILSELLSLFFVGCISAKILSTSSSETICYIRRSLGGAKMMRTFSITMLPRGKKVEFLFVRHALNSKVCMHGIAIKH